MDLGASAVGHPLAPGAFVRDSAFPCNLALAMPLALLEFALIYVTIRADFIAGPLRNAFVPFSFVLLPIRHHHFAETISLTIGEFPFEDVADLKRELASAMWRSIFNLAEVDISSCRLYFSWCFYHSVKKFLLLLFLQKLDYFIK